MIQQPWPPAAFVVLPIRHALLYSVLKIVFLFFQHIERVCHFLSQLGGDKHVPTYAQLEIRTDKPELRTEVSASIGTRVGSFCLFWLVICLFVCLFVFSHAFSPWKHSIRTGEVDPRQTVQEIQSDKRSGWIRTPWVSWARPAGSLEVH